MTFSVTVNDPGRAEYLTSLVAYRGIARGKSVSPVRVDNDYTSQVLLRMGWRWPVAPASPPCAIRG